MKSLNKKANIAFVFVTVTITIISFFTYAVFFQSVSSFTTSAKDDLACRAVIFGKDAGYDNLVGYLFDISKNCKSDDIKNIENDDYDSTMKPIAESMRKCWYKYGEGKKKFMSDWDTTGEWCFKCASLEYKNEGGAIYEYKDLLNWMENNKFESKEGTISYYDYVNAIEVNDVSETQHRSDFAQALKDSDVDNELKKYYFDMQLSTYDFLNSYKLKQINPSEKMYVVYRYIKVEKDIFDKVIDTFSTTEEIASTYAIVRPIKTTKMAFSGTVAAGKTLMNSKEVMKTGVQKIKTPARSVLKAIKAHPVAAIVIGLGGGIISNTNSNYAQYVDVMTQEQYYRLCGTQRYATD